MLVLSRRVNEAIIIGDDVHVTILSVDGDRVRIGIDAPRSTRVFRKELLNQTIDTNKLAAGAPDFSGNIFHGGQAKKDDEE